MDFLYVLAFRFAKPLQRLFLCCPCVRRRHAARHLGRLIVCERYDKFNWGRT